MSKDFQYACIVPLFLAHLSLENDCDTAGNTTLWMSLARYFVLLPIGSIVSLRSVFKNRTLSPSFSHSLSLHIFFSFANCHENQSVIQHQSLSKFYLTEYLVGIAYTNNFLFWLGSHNLTCSAGDLHENLDSMNLSVLLDTNRENMFYFMTILLLKIIIAIYFE